ncbi:hypothetical protein EKD00_09185 [Chlorobium phaeovibrioides]|uniref:hypothetical protein n=1 Tax=Chlorobium phaeovibrioides TaxID=1094 RepID=UPI000F83ECA2|nr:hypothetical protein [Chlorobium phaeovibrioides]RTY33694.1 hypothetical protein EKD00_09185 [Chlorobium phaeovibrioides]
MNDYQKAKEELATAWSKWGVAAISRILFVGPGSSTVTSSGLLAVITGIPWIDLLSTIMMAGIAATSLLTDELQALMPAQKAVKQHPLYFLDRVEDKN